MPTILDNIVAAKREEVARAKTERPESALRRRLGDAPPPRGFLAALSAAPPSPANRPSAVGGDSCRRLTEEDSLIGDRSRLLQSCSEEPVSFGPIRLIAEVKKASPSKGVIRPDFDPVAIARTYAQHGASCISVLTDEPYFQGSLDYLRQVRAAVDLPVLRKDFIIDPYQVVEARAAGADAVLLIAECLDDESLARLHDAIIELGMTPLVELYDPANLPRVLQIGARLLGVNNRNLHTFEVDLEHTLRLRRQIPTDRVLVAESGIRSRADVERLAAAGVQAMLVGESLLVRADVGAAVDELLGVRHS
jgi:indole-3-glycerol phosphate synthase